MSKKYVIGNWKLNPETQAQADTLAGQISEQAALSRCILGVAPSFVHLSSALIHKSTYWVGSQDVAAKTATTGAFTGDVSAGQLKSLGVDFVILGHSERRQYHAEDNRILAQKLQCSLQAGLKVIFCVGETQQQYDAKQTLSVLDEQLSVFSDVLQQIQGAVLIAYEPVWAIGTGLTPTLAEIEQVHQYIKDKLNQLGLTAHVLYGGSVNAKNAAQFASSPLIDGALVGGASLTAQSFLDIAQAFEQAFE